MDFLSTMMTLLPMASKIPMGIASKIAHNKFAKIIEGQHVSTPHSLLVAKEINEQLANVGIPGAERIKENAFNLMASNLSEGRRVTGSLGDMFSLVSQNVEGVRQEGLNVDLADAQTKTQNMQTFANFMAGPMAEDERRKETFDIQKTIDAARERMIGTSELFSFLDQGTGGTVDAYGKYLYTDFLNNMAGSMKVKPTFGESDAATIAFNLTNRLP